MRIVAQYKELCNKVWLKEQYISKRRSICEIARQIGCSWGTVKNALIRLKIKQRRYTITPRSLRSRARGGRLHNKAKRKTHAKDKAKMF